MASLAARRNPDRDRVAFIVLMSVEGSGGGYLQQRLQLEAVIDGDGVTLGFPEDM